ncbi:fumarylacetoacetate hydrolase family protein [Roseibaca sp. V10]|uniref:Fumarylacetoacetate hydrolase family protein n=1 Tax=Roseinatronobacter domitianus TaxID=2940293 RepID=A0ABT0LZ58_9RHOB|nr:fumarylacetoacetate hydrolase family protein [Roseibaca domitiana]MCL1627894.1 fumarylacetoacetate hydrolase family protein [Roseibaca domitiana]
MMIVAAFRDSDGPGLGLVEDDVITVIARGDHGPLLLDLIGAGMSGRASTKSTSNRIALSSVQLEAPVASRDRAIICVGKNYHAHAKEFFGSGFDSTAQDEIPQAPVIFAKLGSSVVADGTAIRASLDPTNTVDYEGELAIVIGKQAHKVSKADAWDTIFGYTICNDVTSRALQKTHNQWLIGKSLDSFGPVGPWIVTADQLHDIVDQELVTTVNGEERQRASIRDLIFDIPTLIETLSATMTLYPGDIIATGTPAGVGIGHKPPLYLKPGDTVSVSISGIGTLSNPVA